MELPRTLAMLRGIAHLTEDVGAGFAANLGGLVCNVSLEPGNFIV
jgi:hypothetical protein